MEECSELSTAGRISPDKTIEDTKSPPSDRASSPETNCAICLGKPQNKCFTDSCLHQFCFACLLEWSKVKAECPLCKQSFTSIIHTVRSIEDYQQHYVHSTEPRFTVEDNIWPHDTPFRYRTTVTSYLEYIVRFESSLSAGHHIIPAAPPHPASDWRRRRQPGTSEYRRNIYNLNLWVQRTRDITGRYRESSPEFYRLNPAQIHRLVPWLNRELNVLVQRNLVQIVMDKILDLLKLHQIRSSQFHDALEPYIFHQTDHFLHEFYSFATSPYDMIGYDRNCNYVNHYNLGADFASSSSTDSDVQVSSVVSDEMDTFNTFFTPLPGPSGINPIEIGSDSDPDDCLFVCSVNAQDRVPEIITIESDDDLIHSTNTNGVDEANVLNSRNENIDDPGPSHRPNRKPRTKAQKKQFSSKRKDRSLDSDESDNSIVVDCHRSRRRRVPQRSATAHPRVIWYSDSSSANVSSSDDENDKEWNSRKVKKSHKIKKKKATSSKRKESARKKHNSKDSKRKSKGTSKHWKKKICRKNGDESSSDDSGPIQHQRRRKSVAINSSPEPEVRSIHDHQITNPYTPQEIKTFVSGKRKLRSVVIKNEPTSRKESHHTSSPEGIARHRMQSSDSSGISHEENDCEINPGSSKQYIKWRRRRENSNSSVDSSDLSPQQPSTSSNVTWLGRHYIDTFSSLNPLRYNLCSNYNLSDNQQDGKSSTSSKLHKRKSNLKDRSEKRKKSS